MILDELANSRSRYLTGASGTVTIATGERVIAASCAGSSSFSVTISPSGPGQVAPPTAGGAITLAAGGAWSLPEMMCLGQLGAGTVFVFTGTDVYMIWTAKGMG